MKRPIAYAVIESDTNGIKKDLSHWLFNSYSEACNFAVEMTLSNSDSPADFKFTVVSLIRK